MTNAREQAAYWFTRLIDLPKDHPDHERWRQWLDADPQHAREYQAFCDLWGDFSSTASTQALAQAVERRHGRRTILRRGALGFAALVAVGLGWRYSRRDDFEQLYATGIGERSHQRLPDGSALYLGADTRLQVRFTAGQRQVYLLQGQAIFDVAHDAERPFTVDGALARVTVLGTRFVVERAAQALRVSVERGRVRLDAEQGALLLTAGQVGMATREQPPGLLDIPASNAFAFEHGRLVLDQARLEDIANQLSRYRQPPVRVLPGNGNPSINAVVQLENIEGFLTSLPSIAPIEVSQGNGVTYLRAL